MEPRGPAQQVMATTLKRSEPWTKADRDSVPLRKLQLEGETNLPRDGGTEAHVRVIGESVITQGPCSRTGQTGDSEAVSSKLRPLKRYAR